MIDEPSFIHRAKLSTKPAVKLRERKASAQGPSPLDSSTDEGRKGVETFPAECGIPEQDLESLRAYWQGPTASNTGEPPEITGNSADAPLKVRILCSAAPPLPPFPHLFVAQPEEPTSSLESPPVVGGGLNGGWMELSLLIV
ncbi:hypothetical protein KM043_005827 [Ampulex compressa]|nr:hypothetical protein KM043_005827 [Ampulex compressa]